MFKYIFKLTHVKYILINFMLRYLYEYEFYHAKSIWQHKMIIKLETIQVWIVSDNIGHHIGHEIDNLIVHQIEISITVDKIIITTR